MRHTTLLAAAWIVVAAAWIVVAPLSAQDAPAHLRVVGSATVEVAPDHARLSVGVSIQAGSPEAAATEMTRRIEAIIDTLAALGFDRDSLPTKVFSIQADRNRTEGNQITGYTAATTLQLTTFELRRIPEFISAALESGATEIGNVQFKSTEERQARSLALERAVEAAREDAEVLARAAGVEIGELVEVSNFAQASSGIMLRGATGMISVTASRIASVSAITPQLLPISVQVVAMWRVEEGGGGGLALPGLN